jgi:hypothetical protein
MSQLNLQAIALYSTFNDKQGALHFINELYKSGDRTDYGETRTGFGIIHSLQSS